MSNVFKGHEISPSGVVSLAFMRDGVLWRTTRAPGASLDDLPASLPSAVRDEIKTVWTPSVVAAWKASLAPEPAIDPVPASVEDWQFAGQAAEEGIITRQEALDWSGSGIVPARLKAAVEQVISDEDQRFKVTIFLRGSKNYPRNHPLVSLLGRVFGKNDDAALDAFWTAAGKR